MCPICESVRMSALSLCPLPTSHCPVLLLSAQSCLCVCHLPALHVSVHAALSVRFLTYPLCFCLLPALPCVSLRSPPCPVCLCLPLSIPCPALHVCLSAPHPVSAGPGGSDAVSAVSLNIQTSCYAPVPQTVCSFSCDLKSLKRVW